MKKLLLSFSIVVLLLGSFNFAKKAEANQISNPSFETDTSGWSLDSDFTRSNDTASDGTWSVKQVSAGNFANFTTTNDATGIAVTANTNYVLTFYAKVNTTSGNSPLLDIDTGSAFGTTITSRDFPSVDWREYALPFNPGSQTKVWIRVHNNGGTVTAYYDNFNISPLTSPAIVPGFVKSIDVMKYTKDVICTPVSTSTADTQLDKIVAIGGTYVSISGFYDDPACAADTPYITMWIGEARARGLKIWLREKDLSFEGDYSVSKSFNPDGDRHFNTMIGWLRTNASTLLHAGDIFTPYAEIQNGGVNGTTFCAASTCQFNNVGDFNNYIQELQAIVPTYIPAGVYVGYYGFDGFVAAGVGNPDWSGTSQLTSATITSMGEVTVDHYPETIGSTFATDLPIMHTALGVSTPILLGEYGTIGATSTADQVNEINSETPTILADHVVFGFNYWHLGPGSDTSGEALVKTDYTNKPGYALIQAFFTAESGLPTIDIIGIKNGRLYYHQ